MKLFRSYLLLMVLYSYKACTQNSKSTVAEKTDANSNEETNKSSQEETILTNLAEYIKLVEGRINQFTVQNSNLRLANVDLWKQIEQLEAQLEKHTQTIKESEERTNSEGQKINECEKEAKSKADDSNSYQQELGQLFLKVQNYRRETIAMKKDLTSCQKTLNVSSNGCQENSSTVQGLKFRDLEDRKENCDNTLRSVRERCDKEAKELDKIKQSQGKIKKNEEGCSGKLRTCTSARDQLEFMKNGYDMVFSELNKNEKDLKSENEKCQQSARMYIDEATRYRLLVTTVGIVVFIWMAVRLAHLTRDRMNQRIRDIAEAKQRDKMAARKKSARHRK